MAEKTKDLVIKDWQQGIADGASLVGFSDMRNVDITSSPGQLKIAYKTSKKSSTTVTGYIKHMAHAGGLYIYAQDDANKVYQSTDGGATWTHLSGNSATGTGNGLVVWREHVFAFGNTVIDAYNINSTTWTNGFITGLQSNDNHMAIVGSDDRVYYCNQSYIGSLRENLGSSFDTATASTYTSNKTAVDLPFAFYAKCIAQLGNYLLIGTYKPSDIYRQSFAMIYPWDRQSPSFERPVVINEYGTHQITSINNRAYIVAGLRHNIYETDGTNYRILKRFPRDLIVMTEAQYLDPSPGGIMQFRGKIYTGMANAASGVYPMGVYSIDESGAVVMENQISTGSVGDASIVKIGALLAAESDTYLIAWKDATTYGIDMVINTERYTSYAANVKTTLLSVGDLDNPKTYKQLYIKLAEPLATDQGVRIKYRTNTSDAFSTLGVGTYDFATYGAVSNIKDSIGITVHDIQIQIELTTGSASATTPKLVEVRLR